MFVVFLSLAVIVAILMAFYFFGFGNSELPRIITKLESLDKDVYRDQNGDAFPCVLSFIGDNREELFVFPSSNSDAGSKPMGSIPYKYKARILHFMNTNYLSYGAEFNKSTEELTIDLIDEAD